MNPLTPNAPLFIVGHPRSGSTLLASLLGRSTRLLALPETHFFAASYAGPFWQRAWAQRNKEAYISYLLDRNVRLPDLGVSRSQLDAALAGMETPSAKDVLTAIFQIKLQAAEKPRVIEKTPRHIEHIDRILSWYPDAKVVVILRDGRDAIASQIAAPWTHSNPRRHAYFWAWSVQEALKKQQKYPNSVTIIRYEDLLTKPEATLTRILEFAGERYDANCLNPTVETSAVPQWETEWKAASTGPLNPENAYKWKASASAEVSAWTGWMAPELAKMGYESGKATARLSQTAFTFAYGILQSYRTHIKMKKYKYRVSSQ